MNFVKLSAAALVAFAGAGGAAQADSISPETFTGTLGVGESVTVRKVVTIDAGGPSDALIDIHFLFDTSGSMGGEINAAKAAANSLFEQLAGFGDIAASVGVYSEAARLAPDGSAPGRVINQNLTTDDATAIAAINAVTLSNPDGGGDGPENGVNGIELSVENLSWRPGSNRFVFVFGDSLLKTSNAGEVVSGSGLSFDTADNVDGDPISTAGNAIAAMTANDVQLFGLSFGTSFTQAITSLGGTAFASTDTAESIISSITAGITSGFAEYSTVTVGDLGEGLPEIAVSTTCVSANIGTCSGASATGEFDRTVDRTFEFDVTFTRVAEGLATFNTYALVDRGIVATERDIFRDGEGGGGDPSVVPLPAAGWMLLAGLGGIAALKRRRKAA